MASIAFAVPQLDVPKSVLERLFSRIDRDFGPTEPAPSSGLIQRIRSSLGRPMAGHWGPVAVSVMVVSLVLGGVWINGRLGEISRENQDLTGQMDQITSENQQLLATVFERDARVQGMVSQTRYLSSMTASPGVSVSLLRGGDLWPEAWGMVACCAETDGGLAALIAVLNLPPLPEDEAYQVWVITKYQRLSVGLLTVDSTGYGQAVIIPGVPFAQIDAIGVTVEPAGGSYDPTGANVLAGDM
ncbi:MAG: anti-sigma factor [Chloroflexi bacterium]|nr:anti-sigma factor [Chloroflexota bacterium]